MATQDDLTAERAAKIRAALLQDLEFRDQFTRRDVDPETKAKWNRQWDEIIVLHLKTARQEALREAARVAREECLDIRCTAIEAEGVVRKTRNVIANELDRLTSEGG